MIFCSLSHQWPARTLSLVGSSSTMKGLLYYPSQVRENFEAYLDGFSANVREIIEKFELRNQLKRLTETDTLYPLIEKFVSRDINLSPHPVVLKGGAVRHGGLSNLGMGYVFEELIRRFSEGNNEKAEEHFTPREIIELMASLIFLPIKDRIQGTTYLVCDPACGTGGMLTEAERVLQGLAGDAGKKVRLELYGQEVNPETFGICQSDMLIKERDPGNIKFGPTLSRDGFPRMEFDFMLSNPPYGKSWKTDEAAIRDRDGIIFQEIIFDHTELYKKFTDDPEFKRQLCSTLFELDYDAGSSPSARQ